VNTGTALTTRPNKEVQVAGANPTDQTVAQLERDWPNWQIWTVSRAVSQPRILWCARRWDWEPGQPVLNAGSAGELTGYLEAEAER
jgi:hypothetical protein